jgi:hypothetical protein
MVERGKDLHFQIRVTIIKIVMMMIVKVIVIFGWLNLYFQKIIIITMMDIVIILLDTN